MESPSCLTDISVPFVADASAVINLSATGRAERIVRALPNRLLVVETVSEELKSAPTRNQNSFDALRELVRASLVSIPSLEDKCMATFESLVIGPAAETLDDGEAATIAYANSYGYAAIIDERKATRICAERFPSLLIASSVDLLGHRSVMTSLSRDELGDAFFDALRTARMSIKPNHLEWVVKLIGQSRATQCPSLPAAIRSRQ